MPEARLFPESKYTRKASWISTVQSKTTKIIEINQILNIIYLRIVEFTPLPARLDHCLKLTTLIISVRVQYRLKCLLYTLMVLLN